MTTSERFWTENVLAGPFHTTKESWASLHFRLNQYPTLLDLMPIHVPGKRVLDYGCGPGHDTLLFAAHGAKVDFHDFSETAMTITAMRLKLHDLRGHPFEEGEPGYDRIHCAGVLHHTEHPVKHLVLFKEVLAPSGEIRLMVYDGDRSEHTQSKVPITHWWGKTDIERMAGEAGLAATYMGSYKCSAVWRPNCQAACYRLRHA